MSQDTIEHLMSALASKRLSWVSDFGHHFIWDWSKAETSFGPAFVRVDGAALLPVPAMLQYLSLSADNEVQAAIPWPTDMSLEGLQQIISAADAAVGLPRAGTLLTVTMNVHGRVVVDVLPSNGNHGTTWYSSWPEGAAPDFDHLEAVVRTALHQTVRDLFIALRARS